MLDRGVAYWWAFSRSKNIIFKKMQKKKFFKHLFYIRYMYYRIISLTFLLVLPLGLEFSHILDALCNSILIYLLEISTWIWFFYRATITVKIVKNNRGEQVLLRYYKYTQMNPEMNSSNWCDKDIASFCPYP